MTETEGTSRRSILKTIPAVLAGGLYSGRATAQTAGLDMFALASDIHQIDSSTGDIENTIQEGSVALEINPVEDLLYANSADEIRALNPFTGDLEWATVPPYSIGDTQFVYDVTEDGSVLYAGDRGKFLFKLDAVTGDPLDRNTNMPEPVRDIDVDSNNEFVYVTGWGGAHVCVDTETMDKVWSKAAGNSEAAEVNHAGDVAYFGDADDLVARDATDGTELWRITGHPGDVQTLRLSDDDSVIYAGTDANFEGESWLVAYNVSDQTERWKVIGGDYGFAEIPLDPASDVLYAANYRDPLTAYSTTDGSTVWTSSFSADDVTLRSPPPGEPRGPDTLWWLWYNYKAIFTAIVGAFALIGAWSRSLTIAAWAGFTAFLYMAFETQTPLFRNIAIVSLVLVVVGFAFKFTRMEMEGEG